MSEKGLAVVTGASTGIGRELARCAAREGYALVIVADEPAIEAAATELREEFGAEVEAIEADLSTRSAVNTLLERLGDRPVDLLLANAGIGLGGAFLDQDLTRALDVVNTNIGGTLVLIHAIGQAMRRRGSGRILVTGSIAGFMRAATPPFTTAPRRFSTVSLTHSATS